MKIEILGTGCPKCRKLYETVQTAVSEAGVPAEIVKVEEMQKIISYAVMMMPALVIDGEVKVSGRIPTSDEIKKWISGK